MNHAILALNIAAFISGGAGLAFLVALGKQRPSAIACLARNALLVLTLIASCNATDFYLRQFACVNDSRVTFIAMNFLALATTAAVAILFRIVEAITARPLRRAFWFIYWTESFLVYFACLAVSLFARGGIDAGPGYFVSALNGALCLLVAGVVVAARIREVPEAHRRFVASLVAFGFVWLVVDVGSELGWWRDLLGLPQIAMAPFFLIILSALSIVRVTGLLSGAGDPGAAGQGTDRGKDLASRADERWGLSARERDVLSLLVAGYENAEISERLFISPHTVKNHVSSVYRKAGVKNRLELIRGLGPAGEESVPGN